MCTLLAFVDDATSRLMQLRFVASESAFDYFRAIRAYLEAHGKPVALYSDKHGIFRVNAKDAVAGAGITQFGRALMELNIDIICANSPQAKGRIERAFGTLQDRMVKELRLAGISTIAAANAWLPGFIASYNARFGRQALNTKDLHRPLTEADDLHEILAWREVRMVKHNLTLHYDRIGAALALVKQQQAVYAPHQRRYDPARRRPPNNLEAPGLPSNGRPPRGAIVVPPT
jgi:hypothetical protein